MTSIPIERQPLRFRRHLLVSLLVVTLSGNERLSEGDSIEILFPAPRVHLFDAGTGEAIRNRKIEVESASTADRLSSLT